MPGARYRDRTGMAAKAWDSKRRLVWSAPSQADATPSACLQRNVWRRTSGSWLSPGPMSQSSAAGADTIAAAPGRWTRPKYRGSAALRRTCLSEQRAALHSRWRRHGPRPAGQKRRSGLSSQWGRQVLRRAAEGHVHCPAVFPVGVLFVTTSVAVSRLLRGLRAGAVNTRPGVRRMLESQP